MGSNKKHKESRKHKHRSRSHTPERPERQERTERKEKHRHHHKKHHKDRKKEKTRERNGDVEMRYEVYNSEDDVVVVAPPPPKISRPATPPPPAISTRSDQSLSVAETNQLRARLGLKPLEGGGAPALAGLTPEERRERQEKAESMGGVDMGEFVHKPADNIAKKVQSEKIKDKLQESKERRKIETKLAKVKSLGQSDSDDDARAWVQKSRKLDAERLKALQREKMLDQLDAEFGVGELVEDEIKDMKRTVYSNRDLRGLQVRHDPSQFQEGRTVVLTLQDKGVLDEEEDVLVNVNMLDDDRYRKNVEVKKKKPNQYDVYNDMEYDEYGDLVEHSILGKYDEEIDGQKKKTFRLGEDVVEEQRRRTLAAVRHKLGNKTVVSLDTPVPRLASEYYTEQELEVKFKKTKKKFRKIRRKPLKADDLARDAPAVGSEAWLQDLGSKGTPRPPGPALDLDLDLESMRRIKQEPADDDAVDVDDLPPPPDLSNVKLEPDDTEQLDLQLALRKARKLKRQESEEATPRVAKVAKTVLSQKCDDGGTGPGGSIVLNSTAEFCRTLGDIPTYGLAGNRDEDAEELMDFERALKEEKLLQDEEGRLRGAWNEVEMDETPVHVLPAEVPILDQEPNVGTGVAGALSLAISKGYLEKEDKSKPSVSRFAHLQAQNYSIEDKTYFDDDKFGRRERYSGPSSDFKEKDSFKPNVKLDYIDDDGHILNAKEAFRYLSHKFHGKGPGKNKVEKRMKKNEQEGLMKQMSSTDTPLRTLNLLQQKQKETQSAFIVLSGSKQMATISKTKM